MDANLSEQLELVRARIAAVERTLSSAPPPDHVGVAREHSANHGLPAGAPAKDASHKKLWERLLEPSVLIPALLTALTATLTWYVKEQELAQQEQRFHQDVSRDQLNHYLAASDGKERLAVLAVILGAPATTADMKKWAAARDRDLSQEFAAGLAANKVAIAVDDRRAERIEEGLPPEPEAAEVNRIKTKAQDEAAKQVPRIHEHAAVRACMRPSTNDRNLAPKDAAA